MNDKTDETEMGRDELFFENETRKHQQMVSRYLLLLAHELIKRATEHDASKLVEPERSTFIKATLKLKGLTYGSPEYTAQLAEMRGALDHHYAHNKHHPEYNDVHGFSYQTGYNDPIRAMDLIDFFEMVCDWNAACRRHADGDIVKSINVNEERFGLGSQLVQLIRNTVALLDRKHKVKT
jgi:hypothetical protein